MMGTASNGLRSADSCAPSPRSASACRFAGCAGSPPATYDLTAADPPPARALRAQLRIAEPLAGVDLDSDRILVRTGPQQLATLAGAQMVGSLAEPRAGAAGPELPERRLAWGSPAGLRRRRAYELDVDIRAFELDVGASSVESISPPRSSRGTGEPWPRRSSPPRFLSPRPRRPRCPPRSTARSPP